MSQPSPVSPSKRVITIESRERRGSDPIVGSKRKDSQKVCNFYNTARGFYTPFSLCSCRLATVTLANVAKNVASSVKDSCRIYGGKLIKVAQWDGGGGEKQLSLRFSKRGEGHFSFPDLKIAQESKNVKIFGRNIIRNPPVYSMGIVLHASHSYPK